MPPSSGSDVGNERIAFTAQAISKLAGRGAGGVQVLRGILAKVAMTRLVLMIAFIFRLNICDYSHWKCCDVDGIH